MDAVSIRFKVRGGFRLKRDLFDAVTYHHVFQSALRFAVVSDVFMFNLITAIHLFQSALRFAVVSDHTPWYAVLTSPVVAVLHTATPHFL